MIDPHDYELTDEEHETLVLISEHAIAPPLSPAAQAVLNAFGKHPLDHDNPSCGILYGALPAALRALANHNTPAWDGTGPACHWTPMPRTRQELLNIADEIEALYAD